MKPITHLDTISDINRFVQASTKHPLAAVVDFSRVDEYLPEGTRISADFYTLMFKNYCANHLKYGRQMLDFQDGSLICIAPKQVLLMDTEIEKKEDMMGWGLFFHPDLIRGTALNEKMHTYSFFSYEVSEALHLSEKERDILYACIQNIETELNENLDNHSQTLIVSNIELLLNYCARFYGRQFITRKNTNSEIVGQVEKLLREFFHHGKAELSGIPTVKYLAESVHLSNGYLSDLLKKETGMNAQDHIHYALIEAAKDSLLQSEDSVSEIAYSLGFEYPQYFSKLFKQKTGKTPLEYRQAK